MSKKTQPYVIIVLILVAITFSGWLANSSTTMDPDLYVTLKKNMTLFKRIYEEISFRYVEEVDPEAFIRAGIEGMTSRLDPYTNFVEQEENDNLRTVTEGKYGGVGMTISKRGRLTVVVEPPYEDDPAGKANIHEGDVLIEVDGKNTEDRSLSEIAQLLRGKPGTSVRLKAKRSGEADILEFRLVRAMIVVHDVSYADIIKDDIGYIRLTRFSKYAADQLEEALKELKAKNMKGLILDLRNNPGGLLNSAVNVADLFLPKGELVVYTKGRSERSNMKYHSPNEPVLPDLPMVVLVNGFSASASEIVAGAIQDLDRGLIIGSRTFGKGLVQTVVPFSRNTALRLTTAKYYVPSGRLIQKLSRLNRDSHIFRNQDSELISDSSKTNRKEYRTKSGRIVYGGGGIKPDIEFDPEILSSYERALIRQSMFFNFAISYSGSFTKTPGISDQLLAEFRKYIEENEFTFDLEGEEEIKNLEKIIAENNFAGLEDQLISIRESLNQIKNNQFEAHRDFIQKNLRKEIAAKLNGSRGQVESNLHEDHIFQTAFEVLNNPTEYSMKLGK